MHMAQSLAMVAACQGPSLLFPFDDMGNEQTAPIMLTECKPPASSDPRAHVHAGSTVCGGSRPRLRCPCAATPLLQLPQLFWKACITRFSTAVLHLSHPWTSLAPTLAQFCLLIHAQFCLGEGVECDEFRFQTVHSGALVVTRSSDGLYHLSVPLLPPETPSASSAQPCNAICEVPPHC